MFPLKVNCILPTCHGPGSCNEQAVAYRLQLCAAQKHALQCSISNCCSPLSRAHYDYAVL